MQYIYIYILSSVYIHIISHWGSKRHHVWNPIHHGVMTRGDTMLSPREQCWEVHMFAKLVLCLLLITCFK